MYLCRLRSGGSESDDEGRGRTIGFCRSMRRGTSRRRRRWIKLRRRWRMGRWWQRDNDVGRERERGGELETVERQMGVGSVFVFNVEWGLCGQKRH
ncbi:hypothetical protein RHMOL_Rhmol06G0145200 [Rhododendron molle]|uniref:Uncharacterized protein n=1 Tax=Rhododendron molle TaxID=49168 RepID=A0ACC0NC63_RHOML|nr:hypothetical protein RHMOL_Rhmol06G0145200 [Rhododendron molle]